MRSGFLTACRVNRRGENVCGEIVRAGECASALGACGSIGDWNPITLRENLVKIGPKVVTPVKYVIFQLAEGAAPRKPLRGNLGADRPTTSGVCPGMRFAEMGRAARISSLCVLGPLTEPISKDEQRGTILYAGLRATRQAYRP